MTINFTEENSLLLAKADPKKFKCTPDEIKKYRTSFKFDYEGVSKKTVIFSKIKTCDTSAIIHKVSVFNEGGFLAKEAFFEKLDNAKGFVEEYLDKDK